jgi:hypothetical protein
MGMIDEERARGVIEGLEKQNESDRIRLLEMQKGQSSLFQSQQMDNLAMWQLELDNIIERMDHLLRGHAIGFDDHGNMSWKPTGDSAQKMLNEYGVQEILKILSMYLNRNTILSNYTNDVINEKVYDLGIDLIDLMYMKYEYMFHFDKNTPDKGAEELRIKIRLYPMLIREVTDQIHSSFLRALGGMERESLRKSMYITQTNTNNPNQMGGYNLPSQKKVWNPFSWFK